MTTITELVRKQNLDLDHHPTLGIYQHGNGHISNVTPQFSTIEEQAMHAEKWLHQTSRATAKTREESILKKMLFSEAFAHHASTADPTFRAFQSQRVDPIAGLMRFIEPLDVLLSRSRGKLSKVETEFTIELLSTLPVYLDDMHQHLAPGTLLQTVFTNGMELSGLDQLFTAIEMAGSGRRKQAVRTAMRRARCDVTAYAQRVECKPTIDEQPLGRERVTSLLTHVFALPTDPETLYRSAKASLAGVREKKSSVRWRPLQNTYLQPHATMKVMKEMTAEAFNRMKTSGIISRKALTTMKQRLKIAPMPKYLDLVAPAAAYFRMPVFGRESGIMNISSTNHIDYSTAVMTVYHEIFGHHAAEVLGTSEVFRNVGIMDQELIRYAQRFSNTINDEGKALFVEKLFVEAGILEGDAAIAALLYQERRAVREVADLGYHLVKIDIDKVYGMFTQLGDAPLRALGETLRIIRNPLDAASYALGMKQLDLMCTEQSISPQHYFKHAHGLTMQPSLMREVLH